MKIRAYDEGDLEALRAIHARQGFGYAFSGFGEPPVFDQVGFGREEGGKELLALPCCG